jgi:PHD/YefM family antitoxin component YafN of YafNO toxin-antitoxin module
MEDFMSNTTTVAKFREKLSNWLDSAKDEAVFINRGEERFALMNEDIYRELQQKVSDLQSSLIAVLSDSEKSTQSDFSDMLSKMEKFKRKKA